MNRKTEININELPAELQEGIFRMMVHISTNDWTENAKDEELYGWLSNGTRLSIDFFKQIAKGRPLVDRKYMAGMVSSPFKYNPQGRKNKRDDRSR